MFRTAIVALSILWPLASAAAEPAAKPVLRFTERALDKLPTRRHNLIESPDGTRIAFEITDTDGAYCRLDGKDGPKYLVVGFGQFSPDSKRFVYVARPDDNHLMVVLDGIKGKPYERIQGTPACVFSPDSQHLGYGVIDNHQGFLVIDGMEGRKRDAINIWGPFFSPDSQRYAHNVSDGPEVRTYVDERRWEGAEFEGGGTDYPVFSPDSRQVALRVSPRGGDRLAVDGIVGPPYKTVMEPTFSPDGKHLAYLACRDGDTHTMLVLDGKEGPATATCLSPTLVFSPDSLHTAYVSVGVRDPLSDYAIMFDNVRQQGFDFIPSKPVFSPDSKHLAYAARRNGQWFAVIDGQEGPACQAVFAITYSPDSKRVAYLATIDGMAQVVLDGQFLPRYSAIPAESLTFSPDSRHFAYMGRLDKVTAVIFDGQPSPAYSFSTRFRLIFYGDNWLHTIAAREGQLVLLSVGMGEPPTAPRGATSMPSPPQRPASRPTATDNKAATLLQLAEMFEQNNQPEKARERYRQIVTQFPGTAQAQTAQQRLDALPADRN